jgi:hypothetical protein
MLTTFDSWKTKEPEGQEESSPRVDPPDAACEEAMEEIARLKKIIERLKRELEEQCAHA